MRTQLHADPAGLFLHDAILDACRRFAERTAIVDASFDPPRRLTYAEYGDLVERLARGLVATGIQPGEVIAIHLPNSWEFAAAYHAATLAGAIPTPLNPSYREREIRHQLENSGAVLLISSAALIQNVNLGGLPDLRRVYVTRATQSSGAHQDFNDLLRSVTAALPSPTDAPERTLATLPYSSGTTGLPKGVMLSHSNLVTNIFQFMAPGETATFRPGEVLMGFLPLYHIYGLNVVLNPALLSGGTVVLVPRFDLERSLQLISSEGVTFLPLVPPIMNQYCLAAEAGRFPRDHRVRAAKSGAAPLAAELPRRFTALTGIHVRQGYGMTEASPVTHMGFLEEALYRPDSIGHPLALTECRLINDDGAEAAAGELVMRGPQFMQGYWRAPDATAGVLRDGWYFSGDVARRDAEGFYFIVDRRKEMIKYKGFPVSPAEIEAVLLEHPAIADCAVISRPDDDAGEIPCAFVVLRDGRQSSPALESELAGHVAERLTGYKQPRQFRFIASIPRNPSGKILRRELRSAVNSRPGLGICPREESLCSVPTVARESSGRGLLHPLRTIPWQCRADSVTAAPAAPPPPPPRPAATTPRTSRPCSASAARRSNGAPERPS
ncbi:MAG TPA: AMP-binding protein [Terriglobales bacterium]|nr:AMP-binding protein [Terriglobales bacterium]